MLAALERFAPEGARWTTPQGGFFSWLTLPRAPTRSSLRRGRSSRASGSSRERCSSPTAAAPTPSGSRSASSTTRRSTRGSRGWDRSCERRAATHYRWDELPKEALRSDLARKLISTERMMLAQVFLDQGCIVPSTRTRTSSSPTSSRASSASGSARTSRRSSTSAPARCSTCPRGCRTRPRRSRRRSTLDIFCPPRRTGSTVSGRLPAHEVKLGLEGRRALVTGGSKGLGAAIAQELVGEGARVAICSRNEDEVRGGRGDRRRARPGRRRHRPRAGARLRRAHRRRRSAGSTSSSTTPAAPIPAPSRR